MRLLSLTANQATFHPVEFNRAGISLIVAAQKDATIHASKKTYNGVGKSLLIAIIHFCLGANRNKAFEAKLPGWQFILRIEHSGSEYRISRATSSQNTIDVNGAEYGVKEFRTLLESMVFRLPEQVPGLSFRSLMPYFIRPSADSYISFDQTDGRSTPYDKLVRNALLLGLDTRLVANKYELRIAKEEIRTMKNSLSKDTVFREYFTGNKNPDIELRDLEVKIGKLQKSLSDFKVADDYHDKQREANATQRDVQVLRNRIVVIKNAIENIAKSLEVKPDLSPQDVVTVYEAAKVALPDKVVKELHDVSAFHAKVIANRTSRLNAERDKLQAELDDVQSSLADKSEELDGLNRFLGEHGAFDEFVAMSDELVRLEASAQKLRDYKGLLATYSNKTQEITARQSRETILANKYLDDNKALLDDNLDKFRSFSGRFYGDRPGGLTVRNNEGDNQTRFDIEAHIEDDASDGINEVKIFCYDMTLLSQQHNHSVEFVFHDSRLLSPVDMRQRATAFRIAKDICDGQNLQYIASMNEDVMESMREQFGSDEFDRMIQSAVVLRLTDDSAAGKLLGIEVDMKYDE